MVITGIESDHEVAVIKAKLLGSLLKFIQVFFKLKTGRDFVIGEPENRESHYITVCRELTNIFYLRSNRLLINVPPGHGKSTMISYFIAWAFAHYPDCRFLYISYSHDVASAHTANIKELMSLPLYQKLFGVKIQSDSSAKDNFMTTAGGAVRAYGSSGSITGMDAGLLGQNRFTGAALMDDMHKPDEVHSDTIREKVIKNYVETIMQRPRADNVPILGIGQMLHAGDVFGYLRSGSDGMEWKQVILKAIDDAGNALCPAVISKKRLLIMRDTHPYVYWSQYQQHPQPAGGGIFKKVWFELVDTEPKFLCTFLTVDTAETDKSYNDATVFSFWGLYEIEHYGNPSGIYALQWIDCIQLRVQPAELESNFLSFYSKCCAHDVSPQFVAIEKKSTGVTLLSVLAKVRGLQVRDIERTRAVGNKTTRFLEAQPVVAQKRISFLANADHLDMCRDHCAAITDNDTHEHDDIADTLYDAIKIGLINKAIIHEYAGSSVASQVKMAQTITSKIRHTQKLRANAWQRL